MVPRWDDVSLWIWVPCSGFACSLHCQEALWRWLDTVYLHKAGCCKITLMWLQLRAERSWQGDVFPHLMFEWDILEKLSLFEAISTCLVVISQPPSMPVWQPKRCFFSCDIALGPDLESRRCPSPPLWDSQEMFLSGTTWCYEMNSCRFVACCLCSCGCGISGRCIRICFTSPSYACQEIFPVDVPVVVALGGHHVRTEQLFPTGKERMKQLLSVQCLCWYKQFWFSPVTGQSYLGLLGFIERNKLKG